MRPKRYGWNRAEGPDYLTPFAFRPTPLDILKYFYEEPVHLEALSAEADPDARRRAAPEHDLAALLRPTHLLPRLPRRHRPRAADRTGLTAIAQPEPSSPRSSTCLHGSVWTRADRAGAVTVIEDADSVWRDPAGRRVLVAASGPVDADALAAVASAERRYGIPSLKRLLAEAEVVAFPEPAHDGWDWSLFAAAPLREQLVAAFRRHPAAGVRRFVAARTTKPAPSTSSTSSAGSSTRSPTVSKSFTCRPTRIPRAERWMQRALALAERGAGAVSPNPLVGAVSSGRTGRCWARGGTAQYGGPHAEVWAVRDVERRHGAEALRESTLVRHARTVQPPRQDAAVRRPHRGEGHPARRRRDAAIRSRRWRGGGSRGSARTAST